MSGIFPASADGGLPPNPADATNPARAYSPAIPPAGTAALYYGNGCDVRLRPEVVNSLISEIAATSDQAGLPYDYSKQENLELAIRYLIQRGMALGATAVMTATQNQYTVALDPPATGYNNYMTICVAPTVTNTGAVAINVNGRGWVYVLRNDSQHLQADDFRAGVPLLLDYQNGYFYLLAAARSQIPVPMLGDIDCWIRTDGNDATGDGTANTPAKAFRTIQGAWAALARKFLPSVTYAINLRLGIPGTYDAAVIGPYGGNVRLIGDAANPTAYQIGMHPTYLFCLWCTNVNISITGVRLVLQYNAASAWCLVANDGAQVVTNNLYFYAVASSSTGGFIDVGYNGHLQITGNLVMEGNGTVILYAIGVGRNSSIMGTSPLSAVITITNCTFNAFCSAQALALLFFEVASIVSSNCIGPRYFASDYSIIKGYNNTLAGNAAGSVLNGGLFLPNT